MKKPSFVIGLLLIIICVSGYFLGWLNDTTEEKRVKYITLGTFSRAIDYAPYYIAKHHGWIEEDIKKALSDYEIQISYKEYRNLTDITSAFKRGDLNILFSAEIPAIIIHGKKNGLALDIVQISCSLRQEIIVNKKSKISTVKDLKDKKIAVLYNTSSHYGLREILKNNGLNTKSVQIKDMSPPAASRAFDNNNIDAWAVWPPFPERKIAKGNATILSGGDAKINSIVVGVQTTSTFDNLVKKAVSNSIEKAKDWIIENPTKAQNIVAVSIEENIKIVKKSWDTHNWGAMFDEITKQDIDNKAIFLKEEVNLLNKDIKPSDDMFK